MTTFENRQKGAEAKWKHDKDLEFKANARRNKLLGLWLAEKFGMTGDDAAAYARAVIESDFERPGDSDVLEKVLADCQTYNIEMDEHTLRREMDRLLGEARAQILAD
jgi:hypothetical protein